MKALKILKERYKELSYFSETQREASNKLVSVLVEMVKVNEAIKELEALQQHIKSLEAQLANTEQLSCDGCTHEKQSSPLFIHCLGCNRAKHLKDKFHDINEPCRG